MVSIKRRSKKLKQNAQRKRLAKKTKSLSSRYQYDILPEACDEMDYEVWFW